MSGFDLERYVEAQDEDSTFDRAMAELDNGAKRSHWMWFVFPQIAGLGTSYTARHFALTSVEEAAAYLLHPVLADRLYDATHRVPDGMTDRLIADSRRQRSAMFLTRPA